MSFGRNPHVAKAQAAEQKARDAQDDTARAMAWREAARQWDRAAEREQNDKRRVEYEGHAEAARTRADEPSQDTQDGETLDETTAEHVVQRKLPDRSLN